MVYVGVFGSSVFIRVCNIQRLFPCPSRRPSTLWHPAGATRRQSHRLPSIMHLPVVATGPGLCPTRSFIRRHQRHSMRTHRPPPQRHRFPGRMYALAARHVPPRRLLSCCCVMLRHSPHVHVICNCNHFGLLYVCAQPYQSYATVPPPAYYPNTGW